jgi:hypothetical protein
MKIGSMYRVKCHNSILDGRVGVLVEAHLSDGSIGSTLMLGGRMYNFAKDELIPIEEV